MGHGGSSHFQLSAITLKEGDKNANNIRHCRANTGRTHTPPHCGETCCFVSGSYTCAQWHPGFLG
jgi:hypothetical protein